MANSASVPCARLHKRHNFLLHHCVRSMIVRGFIALHHMKSSNNLADILTKHWNHSSVCDPPRLVFHTVGNTACLHDDDAPECLDHSITGPDCCLDQLIILHDSSEGQWERQSNGEQQIAIKFGSIKSDRQTSKNPEGPD